MPKVDLTLLLTTTGHTMKCVAIDDEPLALEVISKFCRRIGGMEVSVFVDPEKGLHFIQETAPELVFLDIEDRKSVV